MSTLKKKKKLPFDVDHCPACKKRETIGFLGGSASKRYFCSYCCVEFVVKNGVTKVFVIDSNGTALK